MFEAVNPKTDGMVPGDTGGTEILKRGNHGSTMRRMLYGNVVVIFVKNLFPW